jgi:chromosome segregation ATPase
MSEDKVTLKIIDDTIKDVQEINAKFINVLKTSKQQLTLIQNERNQLEQDKKRLIEETKKLEKEKTQLELDKKRLIEETKKLEKEKQERDQKIGQMTGEQMRLLEEYAKVKEELKKFAKIAAELEDQELDFEKIQALLSIYSVLLEKIFQGQPHFKILFLLHGDKDRMTRDDLKNATGIQGAMVLRAVQELDKVGLIEYDMEKNTAKLLKRLFPKRTIEGKKK